MMLMSWYAVVAVIWLLLPVMADKQIPKITRHHALIVSYGRTLWLDPEQHLKIEVPVKYRCEVSVVRDDPLAERTGYLTPDKFPCDFVKGEVHYVHLGSKAPSKDFVKLSVRVDSATETILRRIVLDITVTFLPMEIVKKNNDLIVSGPDKISTGINDQILQFAYDTERMEACKVRILDRLDSEKGLPRYGRLLNITTSKTANNVTDPFGPELSCSDFLAADIRYQHTKGAQSPNRDYIPMAVEIYRQTGEYVKEYFQVAVRILGARKNQRPTAPFTVSEFMYVGQYVTKLITTDVLDAKDDETNADYLIFNMTEPLGPGEGSIINTDDPHTPITSFYRKDIKDLKIAYKPPSQMANLKGLLVEVVFEAIDTEAFHSEPITLLIKVLPRSTLSPIVTKNKELVLFEGQSRIISSEDNLQISDKDNIDDVRIHIVGGLRHGELYVNQKVARWFTNRDLDNGTIIYQHDNSDTYSDNIILNATDGKQYVEFVFVINIIPVDDEVPIVVRNTGLELDKGASAIITEYFLRASDIDSDRDKLLYLVGSQIQYGNYEVEEMGKPGLQAGFLMLRQKEKPVDYQSWSKYGSYWIKSDIDSFTQQDIRLRKLYYVHSGVEIFEDRFYFQLVDNAERPNQSGIKLFKILIKQVDVNSPQVNSDCSMNAEVIGSRLLKLTRKMLWYTDVDSDDMKLLFTIKQAPYFVSGSNQTKHAGSIVSTDKPDIILSSFTQQQLQHYKVSYKPPSRLYRYADMDVQFKFSVSDPAGHRVDNQIFSIRLHAENRQVNSAKIIKLLVNEYGKLYFSSRHRLRGQQFVIVALPTYGTLYKNGQKLGVNGIFTVDDITNQRLLYQRDADGKLDEIQIRQTGGGEMATFQIQAASKPGNRSADTRSRNQPPTLVKVYSINVEEAGSAIITSQQLQATDPDSDDLKLFFMVNAFPRRGELLVNGSMVNNFTQSDIINNLVVYRHDVEEIGVKEAHDFFNLTLSDPQGHIMGESHRIDFTFHVRISPVDDKEPVIRINDRLEVWEGEKVTLTTSNLIVTDADTIPDDVTCRIDASPLQGFLENIAPSKGMEQSQVGIPIMSFTVRDLLSQRINYVQSNHIRNEPKRDLFALSCSDGLKNSQRHMMIIDIHGRNDELPELFLTNFQVEEGQSMTIDSVLLDVNDRDIPKDNLIIKLLKPPKHGIVVDRPQSPSQPITSFPFSKIKQNAITYNHDGTETTEDVLQFAVTDGVHEVRKDVTVDILPIDDETPRLVTNTGLGLTAVNETRMISSSALRAEDVDSPNENLTYIIRSIPTRAQLTRYERTGQAYNLSRGSTFTQSDINHGMLFYTDLSGVTVPRKEVRFDVTDGRNSLVNQVFYIYMKPEDKVYPIVMSKGVHLKKGSSVTLSTDIITSTDPDSPDTKLEYYITKPPAKGIITMAEEPGIPISKFSQLHLAGHKVKYVHTSQDGSNLDSFEFEVSDGRHYVMRKFHISLLDGDNTRTVVKYGRLTILEGDTKEITSFELKAEDPDNTPDTLVFSITQIPVNGFIMKLGKPTMLFTQRDIDNNYISYQHDGTDTTHDSFSFTVSDGTHLDYYVYPDTKTLTRQPQTFEIDIQAIDNKTPQIIVNRGGTTLEPVPGGGLGLCLSSDLLKAFDPDSNNTQVIYLISDPFNFGTLINIARRNESLKEFSQSDIDENLIYFILNNKNKMNATSDRFYFDLTDPGINELPNQRFSLHWARISLDRILYKVSEVHRSVVITLTRIGFLGETSFIGIRTIDESARINEDFVPNSAEQVQFNPGERYKTWVILLVDDKVYEGSEQFTVQIHSPVMAIISGRREAKITITDPEDRSVISVSKLNYFVEESAGFANIELYRHGDISKEDQIWCVTRSGTASGTYEPGIQSYSDFISKSKDRRNILVFRQGERVKNCSVQLIDDSLYEEDEDFSVYIIPSVDHTIVSSKYNRSLVIIRPDVNDEPRVYFEKTRYMVDENADICQVTVKRAGSDLTRFSSVIIRSKKTNPVSAKANMDYIPVSKTLYFSPGVRTQIVNIVILDDLGQPVREGPEYFELALALPLNARVAVPERTLVVINDTHSDLPIIQFKDSLYTVDEENGMLSAILVRSGDLSQRSAVRCYTRQMTAKAGVDYYERSNSDDDIVTFEAGERTQQCRVAIVDDLLYEGNEEFRLVLGQPKLQHSVGKSLIGKKSWTIIRIADNNDRSGIGFEQTRLFVNEPSNEDDESFVKLVVVRNGDTSRTSQVRLYTKDGSAKADTDFSPLSKVLTFGKNVTRLEVKIKILHDEKREMREAFTVHLTKDRNRIALIESDKVIVYIQENLYRIGVTFPLTPTVVSLKNYDDIRKAKAEPIQGYPLICVTACDPKHPRYPETGSLCSRQSIDNTKTRYSWEVAAATGSDGVTNDFRSIDSQTFFASTSMITLDSIYFGPGSRVRCTARAITYENYKGLGSTSDPVTISRKEGLCLPQQMGDIGSESFSAQITYTGLESTTHPNMIGIRVLVPHIDGMLPALSTKSLSNFEITLTADASRRGQHLCSNLLDTHEVQTKSGFLTDHMTHMSGGTEPYQYSKELRGKSTLRFYHNLNLESCMWTFENHYTMSELVQECGGKIATDGQVQDLTRSYLSVRVPLYVSYIYHSPSALGGWMHFDHSSYLKMTFTYDTAVLWKDGIGTPEGSVLKGYLYPTGVVIRPEDKRLVVTFRTVARFRGTFILAREDQDILSMVMSPDQPNLSFQLRLLRSAPTYNSPEQMWQFVSEFSVRDYSGTYYVKLIPCTVTQNVKYSVPLKCNPRMPITFTLPIRFQQTSDPDAVEFNIRTQFFLLARRDVWLSNETNKVMEQSDAAFSLGSIIYGRIMVDPQQSLGSAYHVSIEKIFVCSGLDGYVPQYNPDSKEYGCLADSKLLSYRFKILDRGAPHMITPKFRNVPFAAMLAIDDKNAHALVEQSNSDGFRFDSSPLFQVASGRQWYLHAIYTIRSFRSSTRGIGKRSTVIGKSSHTVHSLSKRSVTKSSKESPQGAGLLRSIKLVYNEDISNNNGQGGIRRDASDDGSSSLSMKWVLIVVITVCFILLVAVIVLMMLYRRKSRPITTKVVEPGEQMQGTEV